MYLDSPQGVFREDYYRGVKSFINFTLSNPKNISGCKIRCLYVKCKNKKIRCCDDAFPKKRVRRKILVLICTQRPC
jgi:hypothetical protein